MRKHGWMSVALLAAAMLPLVGCAAQPPTEAERPSSATIAPAVLPEQTERLLRAVGRDQVYVFDLKWEGEQVRNLRYWVDVFEKGKQQPHALDAGMSVAEGENGGQLVWTVDTTGEENGYQFICSYLDESGSSTAEHTVAFEQKYKGRLFNWLQNEREITLNRPMTLAALIEHDGNSITSGDIGEFDTSQEGKQALLRYDRVLLFRVELSGDPAKTEPSE